MKSRLGFYRSMMLLLLVVQGYALTGQEKLALLMGVGDYPAESGWASTNAYNDLNLIKETLIQQGYKPESIYTLLDNACTRKGIEDAFSSYILPKLKGGMSVYIHFSGLAQQVRDLDGDESDGFDKAIVPFDAPAKKIQGSYAPGSFVLDDDFEHYFLQIRKALGPNGQLFVTMDASTAPENLNGRTSARGGDEKMQDENSSVSIAEHLNSFFSIQSAKKDIAPLISFYSSSFNQLNDEYYGENNEYYGLFSFALCKSLLQLKSNATYKDWFQKLKSIMNENSTLQEPVLLGDKMLSVFNGQLSGRRPYFNISKIYGKDLVLLDGGKLNKIEKGTEFVLYDESVTDTTGVKPIAKAVVEDAKLTESDLRILESTVQTLSKKTKAYISTYHYKSLAVRLQIDLNGNALEQKLLAHFAFSPFIIKDALKPELIITKLNKDYLILKTRQGEVLFQKELKEIHLNEIPFTLSDLIAEYVRANFLRNLEINNDGGNADIQIVQLNEGKEIIADDLKNKIKLGSKIKLRITNNENFGQYFSVMNIQSDNQINVIIPYDKPAESYYLAPGQSYTTDFDLQVGLPLGSEVIKLIMMPTPLDLRPVIATRGVSNLIETNKTKNPFELFVGHMYIEHPLATGTDLKIKASEISSVNGIALEIEDSK